MRTLLFAAFGFLAFFMFMGLHSTHAVAGSFDCPYTAADGDNPSADGDYGKDVEDEDSDTDTSGDDDDEDDGP